MPASRRLRGAPALRKADALIVLPALGEFVGRFPTAYAWLDAADCPTPPARVRFNARCGGGGAVIPIRERPARRRSRRANDNPTAMCDHPMENRFHPACREEIGSTVAVIYNCLDAKLYFLIAEKYAVCSCRGLFNAFRRNWSSVTPDLSVGQSTSVRARKRGAQFSKDGCQFVDHAVSPPFSYRIGRKSAYHVAETLRRTLNRLNTLRLNPYCPDFKLPLFAATDFTNVFWLPSWKTDLIKRLVSPDDGAFIDVGANVGQTLLDILSSHPTAQYIGFEPNPSCVFYLQSLIKLN